MGGQYSYGYSDPNSVKQEVRTADGVIRGAYSYVDSNGLVQTVNYIADALGFRVGATNLPVHHVDAPVAQAAPVPVAVAPKDFTSGVSPLVHVAAASTPVVSAYHTPGPVMTPSVNYAYLPYATNYGYDTQVAASAPVVSAAPIVDSAIGAPYDASNSQYHAQDDFGQYNYGFSHPTQTKQELKTADGVTRGSYSYVDANGLIQTVNYISDAMGFRVAATNLPVHHVEGPVAQAVDVPLAAVADAIPTVVVEAAPAGAPANFYGGAAGAPVVQVAPVVQATPVVQAVQLAQVPVVQEARVAVAAPVVATQVVAAAPQGSQYHSQDDFGQYSFGYNDGNSVKQEVKTADGVVRGAYSYVDSDGIVQTVNYFADAMGFRVGATNLPVHEVGAPVAAAASAPVVVAAAAPVVAAAPVAAPVVAAYNAPVIAPQVSYSYLPYATNYGYNVPVDQPIVEQAVAETVEETPIAYSAGIPIVASPIDAANSQYHAQDDLGQYNYGFSHP